MNRPEARNLPDNDQVPEPAIRYEPQQPIRRASSSTELPDPLPRPWQPEWTVRFGRFPIRRSTADFSLAYPSSWRMRFINRRLAVLGEVMGLHRVPTLPKRGDAILRQTVHSPARYALRTSAEAPQIAWVTYEQAFAGAARLAHSQEVHAWKTNDDSAFARIIESRLAGRAQNVLCQALDLT